MCALLWCTGQCSGWPQLPDNEEAHAADPQGEGPGSHSIVIDVVS
jgi:hypothetical protein